MARRKKRTSLLFGFLKFIILIPFEIIKYAENYKPTPLIGSKKGRKKKKWL